MVDADLRAERDIYGFGRQRLAQLLAEHFGAPAFRAAQIFEWIYKNGAREWQAMSSIARGLRGDLSERFEIRRAELLALSRSADGTRKYLWEVSPAVQVETVLIRQPGRNTLCVSTQQGCAMGCVFCRTASMGLQGHLSTADIMRQVLGVISDPELECGVQNIVFMGMGEPLHNFEAVAEAMRILMDDHGLGFGPRKITLSTAGFVPGIRQLAASGLEVSLAVSLNAPSDDLRSRLMPINQAYPLAALFQELMRFPLKPRRRITIEYIMLQGVNDGDAELDQLIRLLRELRVKINLIPFNGHSGLDWRPSPAWRMEHWQTALRQAGYQTNIRWSKGADIEGACGQLAAGHAAGRRAMAAKAAPAPDHPPADKAPAAPSAEK